MMRNDMDDVNAERVNIAAVRALIKAGFTAEELRRFIRDRPDFEPAFYQSDANAGLEDITDVLIAYSQRRDLLSELLTAIAESNPRQYKRYQSHLLIQGYQDDESESVPSGERLEASNRTHTISGKPSYEERQKAYEQRLSEQSRDRAQESYEGILNSLAWSIETDRCVLFLGPGCSEAAELRVELGVAPPGAPTQKTLVCKLAEAVSDEELQGMVERICGQCPDCRHCILPDVASQFEELHGRRGLRSFVADLLRAGKPRQFHRELWNLPFSAIYTVNYDELVDKSREGTEWGIVTNDDVFATVSLRIDKGKRPFYKLFGSMESKDVVITVDDRRRLRLAKQKETSDIWRRLKADLHTRTFLFIGYGLGDQEVLETVLSLSAEGYALPPSYAVMEKPLPVTARELAKYSIQIIHKNTDRFFEDLVKVYRELQDQVSDPSSLLPLEQRYPTIWRALDRILQGQTFAGLCLYGRGARQEDKPFVEGQLHVIPKEVRSECERRQAQGDKMMCVSLDVVQLGTNVTVDPWRMLKLLQDLARQLDNQRATVDQPSLDLADRLERNYRESWQGDAEARMYSYWYRKIGEDRYGEVRDAVHNPTPEQQKENRRTIERYVTGQALDWLTFELAPALDDRRLIVLFTDFHLIETDNDWFDRVSQSFLSPLCDQNVGLIITRRLASSLQVDRAFSSYWQNRFKQFNLGDYL